jgi:hypothetical protein
VKAAITPASHLCLWYWYWYTAVKASTSARTSASVPYGRGRWPMQPLLGAIRGGGHECRPCSRPCPPHRRRRATADDDTSHLGSRADPPLRLPLHILVLCRAIQAYNIRGRGLTHIAHLAAEALKPQCTAAPTRPFTDHSAHHAALLPQPTLGSASASTIDGRRLAKDLLEYSSTAALTLRAVFDHFL